MSSRIETEINLSSFEFSCVAFSRLEMCVLVSPLFVSKQTYPLGLFFSKGLCCGFAMGLYKPSKYSRDGILVAR